MSHGGEEEKRERELVTRGLATKCITPRKSQSCKPESQEKSVKVVNRSYELRDKESSVSPNRERGRKD